MELKWRIVRLLSDYHHIIGECPTDHALFIGSWSTNERHIKSMRAS